jgi:hypothetical protein
VTLDEAKAAAAKVGELITAALLTAQPGREGEAFSALPEAKRVPPLGVEVHSITKLSFFAITTGIDLATGELYQGLEGRMRGPLSPPPDARIVGEFSAEERRQISEALAAAIRVT